LSPVGSVLAAKIAGGVVGESLAGTDEVQLVDFRGGAEGIAGREARIGLRERFSASIARRN